MTNKSNTKYVRWDALNHMDCCMVKPVSVEVRELDLKVVDIELPVIDVHAYCRGLYILFDKQ